MTALALTATLLAGCPDKSTPASTTGGEPAKPAPPPAPEKPAVDETAVPPKAPPVNWSVTLLSANPSVPMPKAGGTKKIVAERNKGKVAVDGAELADAAKADKLHQLVSTTDWLAVANAAPQQAAAGGTVYTVEVTMRGKTTKFVAKSLDGAPPALLTLLDLLAAR
jgi:hypothetical protein